MNATAVRLPDQFSPGAAAASAATPTCCCCCCCCAISSVGAAVHIPEALFQDTKDVPDKRNALLVLPSAIFPLLVVVLPFITTGLVFDLHWGWWAAALGAALAWAVAAGYLVRSPKPWMSLVRLLGWAVLWCVEPFVVLFALGPIASLGVVPAVIVVGLYLGGALFLGHRLFQHYRSKK